MQSAPILFFLGLHWRLTCRSHPVSASSVRVSKDKWSCLVRRTRLLMIGAEVGRSFVLPYGYRFPTAGARAVGGNLSGVNDRTHNIRTNIVSTSPQQGTSLSFIALQHKAARACFRREAPPFSPRSHSHRESIRLD